jgi:hypothetical protein
LVLHNWCSCIKTFNFISRRQSIKKES